MLSRFDQNLDRIAKLCVLLSPFVLGGFGLYMDRSISNAIAPLDKSLAAMTTIQTLTTHRLEALEVRVGALTREVDLVNRETVVRTADRFTRADAKDLRSALEGVINKIENEISRIWLRINELTKQCLGK